ncbi:FAD-dependent oxidoreductase [Desulfovermiculus halophilus]|uniref:FAD-dependent oxidoreductase n=1 Tax=Desulfovermiculus halophilus TaxID=339722 RepID=UPI00048A18CF|nr:FAD-dependent oxidoreductase [Desulfovermiculus halophilus]
MEHTVMQRNLIFSNWGQWTRGSEKTDHSDLPQSLNRHGPLKAFMGWDGFMVWEEDVHVVDMCRAYMQRVQQESCGQCFPCRLGTALMADILERICSGNGHPEDLDQLAELARLVTSTAKCGIGETGPRPILDALTHYRQEFEQAVAQNNPIPRGTYHSLVTAPCTNACPSHLDIPAYVEKIRLGQYKEALEVVRNDCPMPATIGRVCVRPCEMNCRRTKLDEPIAIKALKRFLVDYEQKRYPEAAPVQDSEQDANKGPVAIVGAGPAGLSCAYYLAQRGYQCSIYESLPEPGGMAAVGIPDYRLPRDVLRKEVEYIQKLGVSITYNTNIGQDITIADLRDKGYQAVFVGAGAPESSKMRCEGEDAGYQCFMTGVEFLRRIAQGEKPLEGKRAVVIGGGNVAMDCVRSARRLGFEDVNLVYRRTLKEMPADPVEIKEAKEEGIAFHYQVQPVKILAENNKVTGLECIRMELGEPDESGRRRPEPVEGSNFVLDCDVIIPAIGQTCVVDCVLPDEQGVELSRWKTLVVDPVTFQSSEQDIFGGGDCITGPATLIAALAAGKKGAKYIDQYLQSGQCLPDVHDELENYISELGVFYPFEKMPYKGMDKRARQPALDPEKRIEHFGEVEGGFDQGQALREASRCLRCYRIGMAAVAPDAGT